MGGSGLRGEWPCRVPGGDVAPRELGLAEPVSLWARAGQTVGIEDLSRLEPIVLLFDVRVCPIRIRWVSLPELT